MLHKHILGVSVLAVILAGPALAKDKIVKKEKQCRITVENGETTKVGDCDDVDMSDLDIDVFRLGPNGKTGHRVIKMDLVEPHMGGLRSIMGSHGMPHMRSFTGRHMNMEWDTNDDGEVSTDEVKAGKRKELTKYDSNRNRSLSLDEYEALWTAKHRNEMVDQFQDLDEDGDGKVTQDEFAAKATNRMRHHKMMVRRMEVHEDKDD